MLVESDQQQSDGQAASRFFAYSHDGTSDILFELGSSVLRISSPLPAEKLAAATTPVNDSRPKTHAQRQKGKKKPSKN